LKGRQVGILFAEGSDKKVIDEMKKAIEAKGGAAMLIAPKVGGIKVKGGMLEADGQLAGTPSVLLDAVALVLTEDAAIKLTKDSAAVGFVCDAWAHLKAIGHDTGAKLLLDHCHVPQDADGVTATGSVFVDNAAMRFYGREPDVRDLA